MRLPLTRAPVALTATLVSALLPSSAAGASSAASGRVIETVTRPTAVAAFGDRVVYSRHLGGKRFALVLFDGRRAFRLAVRPRAVPFDADIGKDERGRLTVVYSRCAQESIGRFDTYLPNYIGGEGCDLYAYDVGRRQERRLEGLSRRDALEYHPAIWRGRVAFVRVYNRRPGPAGVLAHLYYADLDGGGLRRLRARGPRGPFQETKVPSANRGSSGPGPVRLDLRGATLVYSWRYTVPLTVGYPPNRYCPQPLRPDQPKSELGDEDQEAVEIRTATIRGPSRLIAQACTLNLPSNLVSPVIDADGSVIFGSIFASPTCSAREGSRLTRWSPSEGSRTVPIAPLARPPDQPISISGDQRRLYLASSSYTPTDVIAHRKFDFSMGSPLTPAGPTCPGSGGQ